MSKTTGLSDKANDCLKFLGNFGPTVNRDTFKGTMLDDEGWGSTRVYLAEHDFRELAESFLEIAGWIAKNKKVNPTGDQTQSEEKRSTSGSTGKGNQAASGS